MKRHIICKQFARKRVFECFQAIVEMEFDASLGLLILIGSYLHYYYCVLLSVIITYGIMNILCFKEFTKYVTVQVLMLYGTNFMKVVFWEQSRLRSDLAFDDRQSRRSEERGNKIVFNLYLTQFSRFWMYPAALKCFKMDVFRLPSQNNHFWNIVTVE